MVRGNKQNLDILGDACKICPTAVTSQKDSGNDRTPAIGRLVSKVVDMPSRCPPTCTDGLDSAQNFGESAVAFF